MHRSLQAILILSTWAGSWLGMLACHEFGHVLNAWLSGGMVVALDLPLVGFSQTHVAPNPHPQFTAWGGVVWGSLLPLFFWAAARRWFRPYAFLAAFFAGFCLAANGVYLAAGSFIGAANDADDAHELLRHGAARWQLVAFGLVGAALGLQLWHGLGKSFGLRVPGGVVDRKAAFAAGIIFLCWVILFLIVAAIRR